MIKFYILLFIAICNATHEKEEMFCIAVNGGGARGAGAAAILDLIHTNTEKNISQIFKGGMTGVSTGALIVLALAAKKDNSSEPLLSTAEVIRFYEDHVDGIFQKWSCANCINNASGLCASIHDVFCCSENCCCQCASATALTFSLCGLCAACKNVGGLFGPKYSNQYLKEKLTEIFGERTLKDTIVPVQIVAYNIDTMTPQYFNSIDNPNMKMVDAALASAAAPTFFPPHKFSATQGSSTTTRNYTCIDGGIFDNNPSVAALAFAAQIYNKKYSDKKTEKPSAKLEEFTVVSIGTGKVESAAIPDNQLSNFGLIQWAPQIIEMGISGTMDANDNKISQLLPPNHYHRIQFTLSPEYKAMDENHVSQICQKVYDTVNVKNICIILKKGDIGNINVNIEELNQEAKDIIRTENIGSADIDDDLFSVASSEPIE